MINGQITCREGHSSWWGRARDWGGKPLQQTLPHAKDLGSSKLKKMVIVLRWTTTQVLLAALMWLELLCLWLFPGCQIDVLKAFALKIWLYFCLRIGNHCIVDSSPEEESCSSASLVVAVTPDGSISTLRKVFIPFFLPARLNDTMSHDLSKTCRWEGVASILPPWYQQPRWQCLLQKRYS